jgi:TolB-like protein
MNNKIMPIILLSIWVLSVNAQQGSPVTQATQKNYAILNIKCGAGVTEPDGDLISDRLRAEIFNTGNANVMERNQMQEILKEQGFQQSGATCTDEDCLVKMGQMLGVHYLVAGSLGKLGSMYMVNMRTIDVQTGKIVRAVSVDVKGDIEDLVEYLPRIALQLTTDARKQSTVISTPEPVTSKPPKDTVKPQEEPVPTDTTTEIAETPKEPQEPLNQASKGGRNKNRAGIGLMFDLYGESRLMYDRNDVDSLYLYNFMGEDTADWYLLLKNYSVERTPIRTLALRFIIKAGQVITIDVGPSITFGSEKYTYTFSDYDLSNNYYTYTSIFDLGYSVPAVHLGVNFVKRWFPVKMNIGLFANISIPITSYSWEQKLEYLTAAYNNDIESDDDYDVDFSVSFGTRTGAEIMAGTHVGFSVDFLFNWLRWSTEFDFADLTSYTTDSSKREYNVVSPLFGLGLGVNFYF